MEKQITLEDVFNSMEGWLYKTWDISKGQLTVGTNYIELRKDTDMDQALEDALIMMMVCRDFLLQAIETVEKVG